MTRDRSIGLFEFGGIWDFDRVSFNAQSRYGYVLGCVSREGAKARRKRRLVLGLARGGEGFLRVSFFGLGLA